MFDDIGPKLKRIASILCCIGLIASIAGGVFLMFQSSSVYHSYAYGYGGYSETTHPYLWIGVGVLVGGVISTLLTSWILYGIGEAAENSA